MIKEYLIAKGAIGRMKAISARQLSIVFKIREKDIPQVVTKERTEGAMICSNTNAPHGYFMPETPGEIQKQKERMEKGIAIRAGALRPFREYEKAHRKGSMGRGKLSD